MGLHKIDKLDLFGKLMFPNPSIEKKQEKQTYEDNQISFCPLIIVRCFLRMHEIFKDDYPNAKT